MTATLRLIGYIGRNRQVRQTRERTHTATFYNEVAEMKEEYDVRVPPRDYIVLSLATHHGSETIWRRLVVWSPDTTGLSHVRLARKGDRVEVTGRPETFSYLDKDGNPQELRQIVVESYRPLKLKSPEIP